MPYAADLGPSRYSPAAERHEAMTYRRCGRSGLRLPAISLGDELVISTKAGYNTWPGPYGEWGSRKYLLASLQQSLRRMRLDHVDIFYSHCFDPRTSRAWARSGARTSPPESAARSTGTRRRAM